MADRMLQDFEGDKIAMSYQGELAVLRRQLKSQQLKSLNSNGNWPSLFRKLNKDICKPHDVCFAPNNYLVVSESVKIFTLEGDQEQVNRFVIGYNAI